jgi:hypothetical protein
MLTGFRMIAVDMLGMSLPRTLGDGMKFAHQATVARAAA